MREEIVAAADERGLPIAWPLLDLQDRDAVTFIDVWGGFEDRIVAASARYRADAVLIGEVRPGTFGNEVEWLFVHGVERQALPIAGVRDGLDVAADRYAADLATVGGASIAVLTVHNVLTPADYGRVVSYLGAAERPRARRRGVVRQRHSAACASRRAATRACSSACSRSAACCGRRLNRARSEGWFSRLSRRRNAMSLRFLPNAICIARMLLVAPLVLWIVEGRYAAALLVLIVAGLSDGLDGFLAKRFDWRTRLGGLLDPAADKLLLVAAFSSLTYVGLVPLALTLVVVGRDVLIVLGAVCYQWLIAPVEGEPAAISKLNTACQLGMVFFTLTSAAFAWPPQVSLTVLGAAVVFTSIVSGLTYVLRWRARAWRVAHGAR